jgi:NDP-sugar pyrophosphorylase family protein
MTLLTELLDVSASSHPNLFDGCDAAPWAAISRLPDYLRNWDSWGIDGQIAPNVIIDGPVAVGPRTIVKGPTTLKGPLVIGPDCFVGDGVLLRESILDAGCLVGHSSEVVRSVLCNGANVPHFNYVGDSVLGQGVHLGGGVLVANLKLNESEVFVTVRGDRFPTGLTKFGTIIGDGTNLGAGCILMPGAIFGQKCVAYAGAILRGWYAAGSRIKVIQKQEVLEQRATG